MTTDQIAALCLALPGTREDLKWGSNRVFSVAGNKMFAVLDFLGENLAFKVHSDLFLGFRGPSRHPPCSLPGKGALDQHEQSADPHR